MGVGEELRLRFKAAFMLFLMISLMFAQFSFAVAVENSVDENFVKVEATEDVEGCYEKEYLKESNSAESQINSDFEYSQLVELETGNSDNVCKIFMDEESGANSEKIGLLAPGCGPVECGAQGAEYGQICKCSTDTKEEKSTCKMETECSNGHLINCGKSQKVTEGIDVIFAEKDKEEGLKSLVLFFIPDSFDKEQTFTTEFTSAQIDKKTVHDSYFYKIMQQEDGNTTVKVYVFDDVLTTYTIDVKWSEDLSKQEFSVSSKTTNYLSDKYSDYKLEKVLNKDENNKQLDFSIIEKNGDAINKENIDKDNDGYLVLLTKQYVTEECIPDIIEGVPTGECTQSSMGHVEYIILGAEFESDGKLPSVSTIESQSFSGLSDLYPAVFKEGEKYSYVKNSDITQDMALSKIVNSEGVTGEIKVGEKNYRIGESQIILSGLSTGFSPVLPLPEGKKLQAEISFGNPVDKNKVNVDNDVVSRLPSYENIFQFKGWIADSKTNGASQTINNFCDADNFLPGAKLEYVIAAVFTGNEEEDSRKMFPVRIVSSDNYCSMKIDLSDLNRKDYTTLHTIDLLAVYSVESPEGKVYYNMEATENFKFWSGNQGSSQGDSAEDENSNNVGIVVYSAKGTELSEIANSKLFGTNMKVSRAIKESSDICVSKEITCESSCIKNGGRYYSQSIVGNDCKGTGLKSVEGVTETVSGYVCCADNSEEDKCGGLDQPLCVYGCNDGLSACKKEGDSKGVCKESCVGGKNVNPAEINNGGVITQCSEEEKNNKDSEKCDGTLVDPNQGVTSGASVNAPVESDMPPIIIKSIVVDNDASVQTIIVDDSTPDEIAKTIYLRFENLDDWSFEDIIIYADLVSVSDPADTQRVLIAPVEYGNDESPGFGYFDRLAFDMDIPTLKMGDYKLKVKIEQAGSPGRETERFWYGDSQSKGIIKIVEKTQAKQDANIPGGNAGSPSGKAESDESEYDLEVPSFENKKFTNEELKRIERTIGNYLNEKTKYDSGKGNIDDYFKSILDIFVIGYTYSSGKAKDNAIDFVENTKEYTLEQKVQFIDQFDDYIRESVQAYNAKLISDNIAAAVVAADTILSSQKNPETEPTFWGAVKQKFKSPIKNVYNSYGVPAEMGTTLDYSIILAINDHSFKVKNLYYPRAVKRIAEIKEKESESLAEDTTSDMLHYRSSIITKDEKTPAEAHLYLNHLYYTPAVLRDADNYVNLMYGNFFCTSGNFIQDWTYYDACQTLFVQRVNDYHIYDQNFKGIENSLDTYFSFEEAFLKDDRTDLDSAANRMHWEAVGNIVFALGIGLATGSIIAGVLSKVATMGKAIYLSVTTLFVTVATVGIGAAAYQHYMCFDNYRMREEAFESRYNDPGSDLIAKNTILARCTEDVVLTIAFFGGGFATGGKTAVKDISKSKVSLNVFKRIFSKELFEKPRIKSAIKRTETKIVSGKKVTTFKFREKSPAAQKMSQAFSEMFKTGENQYVSSYYMNFMDDLYSTMKVKLSAYKDFLPTQKTRRLISSKEVNSLKANVKKAGLTEQQEAMVLQSIDDEIARMQSEFETAILSYQAAKKISVVEANKVIETAKVKVAEKQKKTGVKSKEKQLNKEKSVPKANNGLIDSSLAYSSEGSLNTVLTGQRDLGISSLSSAQIKAAESAGLKLIKVNQLGDVDNMYIYYRSVAEARANRLFQIMNKHDGGLVDETIEEAFEIGRALGYTDESIATYVNRVYTPSGVKRLFINKIEVGKGKVQGVVMDGNGGVVQDAVFSNGRGAVGVADGVSGAGAKAADSAKMILEGVVDDAGRKMQGLVDKLDDLVNLYGDDYARIYSELDNYAWKELNPVIAKKTGDATTTVIVSSVYKNNKLITYRIGDTEARIIRKSGMFSEKKIYHLDQLYDAGGNPLFEGATLNGNGVIFTSPLKTGIQAYGPKLPNQIGSCSESPGFMSVHNLKPGDRIILSSDGFTPKKGSLNDGQILNIVSKARSPEEAEQTLISEALRLIKQTRGSETRGDDLGNMVLFVQE